MKDKPECLNCLYSNRPCEYEDRYYVIPNQCPCYHPLITFKEAWTPGQPSGYINVDGKLVQTK